jgi:hypothetical protein
MNRLLGMENKRVKQKNPMDSIGYAVHASNKTTSGEDERWEEMAHLYRRESLDLDARTGAIATVDLTLSESLNRWPGSHALSR